MRATFSGGCSVHPRSSSRTEGCVKLDNDDYLLPEESGPASFKTPAMAMLSRGGIQLRRSGSSGSCKLMAAGVWR